MSEEEAIRHLLKKFDAEVAARADQHVKSWNGAIVRVARDKCNGCRANMIRVSVPWNKENTIVTWRHLEPFGGSEECTAGDILMLKLPEVQPVEEGER